MNRRTFLKGSVGVAGLSLGAPYIARAQAPITLRWAHFAQEDHPANIAAKQFASQVEARTNGAIKISIFPNNALGGPPEQAQGIKLGSIDMGLGQNRPGNTAGATPNVGSNAPGNSVSQPRTHARH